MKIDNRYITIGLLVCVFASSCSKSLERIPLSQISDGSFWKTSSDFKQAANDFYFSLEGPTLDDNRSDIAFGTSPNNVSDGSYIPSATSGFWDNSYATIRGCNYLLQKAAQSSIKGELTEWVAEAHFFRAYTYFNLLKNYGGVPLVRKVLDITDSALYGMRPGRSAVIDFILADLDSAITGLPLQNALTGNDLGRVSRGAALALKARAALFEGSWEKFHQGDQFGVEGKDGSDLLALSAQTASEIMQSKQYALYDGKGEESYRYLFLDAGDDCSGCILDHRYDIDFAAQPGAFGNMIMYGEMVPTKRLVDMYLCTDGLPISHSKDFDGYDTFTSEFQNRDPRMVQTILTPGKVVAKPFFPDSSTAPENWPGFTNRPFALTGYMLYKFLSENPTENSRGRFGADWHIIRYAEVLLIYAEARFEQKGSISDADLDASINLLRDRAGMPHLTNQFVQMHGLDMREEIRRERTVELAFEGHRLFDLFRWNTARALMPKAVKGFKYENTAWENKEPYASIDFDTDDNGFIIVQPAAARSFDPNKNYLFPLPLKQIALNPQLKQNPGW